MDLSNKSLALLLVAAIVISLGGTMISLNKLNEGAAGYATGYGRVNLTITSNASCTVSNNVSFGAGGQPATTTTLSTESANAAPFADCTTTACSGIEINNTGNVNLIVNFTSNANASSFLVQQSGLDPLDFQYMIKNGTNTAGEPGCISGGNQNWTWYSMNSTVISNICSNLTAADANDIVTMEFNITLESDVVAGNKLALLTINCVQTA